MTLWNKYLPKGILIIACMIATNAIADKINRVTLTLPGYACKNVSYDDGRGTVYKNSDGNYTLTNYQNFTTGENVNNTYTCWNNKDQAPSSIDVVDFSGSFAYIDPTAWSDPIRGGIRFTADNTQLPCNVLLSIAYATSPNYQWCNVMGDTGTFGGKDNLNNWYVDAPSIHLNGDWHTLYLGLNEWGMRGDWHKPNDGIALTVTQAYLPSGDE